MHNEDIDPSQIRAPNYSSIMSFVGLVVIFALAGKCWGWWG